MDIQHGDLIEQRRGGVDVLRLIARDLATHGQSGAVLIRPNQTQTNGWLLFRLGHPVMAFHQGETDTLGLEALMSIEHDALDVANEVNLYELSMSALRQMMEASPESVLHLELEQSSGDSSSWWSSVRLPSSSWRRADRPEEMDGFVAEPEYQRRPPFNVRGAANQVTLQPGGAYVFDSPDPHPMIELGVELAERGLSLLGLFGLPHASTDVTNRLPGPTCYSLFTQRGEFELLSDEVEILRCVEAFLWANENAVVLLDGLDRVGNALGDSGMLDLIRSIIDGVRFNDHTLLLTTDLGVFQLPVRHSLMSEFVSLTSVHLERWLAEPEGLFDHPLLLPIDEDEARWVDAQLRHHVGDTSSSSSVAADFSMEGGGVEPSEEERKAAVEALHEVVESWSESNVGSVAENEVHHARESSFMQGRFISDIPQRDTTNESQPTRPIKNRSTPIEPQSSSPPKVRAPQRLPARKLKPSLPQINTGLAHQRSSAVSRSERELPDWPEKKSTKDRFIKENLDVFQSRQDRASLRHQDINVPTQTRTLGDTLHPNPSLDSAQLPEMNTPQTVPLRANSDSDTLPRGMHNPSSEQPKAARESSAKEQKESTIDEIYERWNQWEDEDYVSSTALYNEKGELLKKFKEDKP
tara:strand:+ start:42373 stop:44289 length:1917 start_codon:yes stop_codon:yes gene_type:complete